jgi:subtilisin family serine protease
LFTTYNPKSYWATFRSSLVQDGQGLYGLADAVSAAAPIVTGIIALMLEVNPQLDAAQVKEILRQTARTDQFTGQTPNPKWGYGKVDAYAALARVTGPAAGPTISGITVSGKKVRISGAGFGTAPRVLINDIERNEFVTAVSDQLIQMKGKAKFLGLKAGDNTVQVIDSSGAASARFTFVY